MCRCSPLTVANGVVMPDTALCNSIFSACVANKWDATMGVDDTDGLPLDIDMLCMGELQSVEQCKAETQVLYGANIRIVCQLGYTNGTAATLRPFCTSDASFSHHATCERKSCGIFHTVNNSVSEVKQIFYMLPTLAMILCCFCDFPCMLLMVILLYVAVEWTKRTIQRYRYIVL